MIPIQQSLLLSWFQANSLLLSWFQANSLCYFHDSKPTVSVIIMIPSQQFLLLLLYVVYLVEKKQIPIL